MGLERRDVVPQDGAGILGHINAHDVKPDRPFMEPVLPNQLGSQHDEPPLLLTTDTDFGLNRRIPRTVISRHSALDLDQYNSTSVGCFGKDVYLAVPVTQVKPQDTVTLPLQVPSC